MIDIFFYIFIVILSSNNNNDRNTLNLYSRNCIDCHKSIMEATVKHSPTDDCTTCHISNGEKHPNKSVQTFNLAEKLPALCYNCHESFNKTNIHPPVESGDCNYCHSPHSTNNSKLLLEKSSINLCEKCHDINEMKNRIIHKPLGEGNCTSCHDPHQSDFQKFIKEEIPQLCFSCHDELKKTESLSNVHPPFESECLSCHKHHSSKENSLLSESLPGLCYSCHGDFQENYDKSEFKHLILEDKKSCINCHSPHASAQSKFLKDEINLVCLKCHSKSIVRKKDKTTIVDIKQLLQKKNVHGAILGGTCIDCHNPHYSTQIALLKSSYTKQGFSAINSESFNLCFDCHDKDLFEKENTQYTNFRNGDNNLHYLHLITEKGKSCSSCHNVHASMNEHLIEDVTNFGKWNMPINFKSNDNGGSCFPGCHTEKSYMR